MILILLFLPQSFYIIETDQETQEDTLFIPFYIEFVKIVKKIVGLLLLF